MYDYERLNLKNMHDLSDEVENVIPSLIASLGKDPKKKASVTITLTFNRFKDSDSRVEVATSVKPTYPSKKQLMLASMDLSGNLSADAVDLGMTELPRQRELAMAEKTGGNE